jgi:hypothetical protein
MKSSPKEVAGKADFDDKISVDSYTSGRKTGGKDNQRTNFKKTMSPSTE